MVVRAAFQAWHVVSEQDLHLQVLSVAVEQHCAFLHGSSTEPTSWHWTEVEVEADADACEKVCACKCCV